MSLTLGRDDLSRQRCFVDVADNSINDAFGQGVTVPVIKDRLANASSTSNHI